MVREDIESVVVAYCEGDGRADTWCNNASALRGDSLLAQASAQYLPPSYFKAKFRIDVCDQATPVKVAEKLQAACNRVSFAAVEGLAANLVIGLGKHIQVVATKQVIDFTVNEALKKFCAATIVKTPVSRLLKKSCGLTTIAIDAITLSSLKSALRDDLYSLPATLQAEAMNLIPQVVLDSPVFKVLGAAAFATYEIINHRPPLLIVRDAYKALATSGLKCNTSATLNGPCLGLIALAVGDAAARAYEKGSNPSLVKILEQGFIGFCSSFAEPAKSDALCVIEHPDYGKIIALVVPFLEAYERLAKHLEAVGEGGSDDYSEVVLAFKTLLHRLINVVESDPSLTSSDKDTLALVRNFVEIVAAIAMKNPAEVRLQLLAALENPHVEAKLDERARKGLSFVLIILGATDGDDVSKVFADFAAPVGTYKMKFDRETTWTIAINAFIGPQVAGQWRFNEPVDTTASVEGSAYRVASPVGLDVTEPSGVFGFGVSVIDPLALTTITEEGKEDKADLASALLLGGYARVALGKSPFSLMVHSAYRPGFRSQDDCVTDCFRGAFEVGGAIVVDVPLLVLQ